MRALTPQCEALDGLYTHMVACGSGFTLFLVEPGNERVDKMPLFTPEVGGPRSEARTGGAGARARASAARAAVA